MSNTISLYVTDLKTGIEKLRRMAEEDDFELDLECRLGEENSDYLTHELSMLYEKKASELADSDRWLLRVILWSWLGDGERINDLTKQEAEALGLDLAISPQKINERSDHIRAASATRMASVLFAPNAVWKTREELGAYLALWIGAFQNALTSGQGLLLKVWV